VGYSGPKISLAVNEMIPVTSRSGRKITRRVGEALEKEIVALTPVDTGQLKESWHRGPVRVALSETGHVVWEISVSTEKDYAPYVEHGTGIYGPKHAKYPIRPKKPGGWLHWIGKDGEDVFAKLVMHQGSPGQHMVAKAVAGLLITLFAVGEPLLQEWVREAQFAFLLGGGRHARPGSIGRTAFHA
jgi:hypothetical protein